MKDSHGDNWSVCVDRSNRDFVCVDYVAGGVDYYSLFSVAKARKLAAKILSAAEKVEASNA